MSRRQILLPPWEDYKDYNVYGRATADDRFFHTEFWEPEEARRAVEIMKREIDCNGGQFNSLELGAISYWPWGSF